MEVEGIQGEDDGSSLESDYGSSVGPRLGECAFKLENNECGFFFNLLIAEQVSAANYFPIDSSIVSEDNEEASDTDDKKKKRKKHHHSKKYEFEITPEMTDNFGNRLVEDQSYIPVVLSYYNGEEIVKKQYSNALSDYEKTGSFT